jgi:RHH-type proline utilization regulon transcriptional repressor/proline dehydrogenase/delta 1-pyrroline-5-carboxylate dehydrogenase
VVRYRAEQLPEILQTIRKTGFGLTLGVHSRIEGVAEYVFRSVPVGNTYVNRNMIGAVVGVQPFGGQGLSGTGPKAGGPHYLPRFATERTLTINTVAIGGNVELLS